MKHDDVPMIPTLITDEELRAINFLKAVLPLRMELDAGVTTALVLLDTFAERALAASVARDFAGDRE